MASLYRSRSGLPAILYVLLSKAVKRFVGLGGREGRLCRKMSENSQVSVQKLSVTR
jgi:hypothetical protein